MLNKSSKSTRKKKNQQSERKKKGASKQKDERSQKVRKEKSMKVKKPDRSARVKKGRATDGGEATTNTTIGNVKTTMSAYKPQPVHPVVEAWVVRALDLGVEKLRDEFRMLAKYTRPDMTKTAFDANQSPDFAVTKNRYQDVPCQDQSIVPLVPPAPNTYIHANFVGCPMVPEKRFICAQGPLDQTIDDFWWMIWQQKVEQIVMLCKTIETGKNKCAQYWPLANGEKRQCAGGLVVENTAGPKNMDRDPEIKITQLTMSFDGKSLTVRHLHWPEWPDRGVPPCKLTSLELLSNVRGSKAPIVVHCSAGIGRTGTIVAIEYILEKIAYPKEKCPPMPDIVKQLRDQRAFSIQNDQQYLYIHRVLLNYFLDKYKDKYAVLLTPDNISKYNKFIQDYNAAVGQA